MITNLSLSNSTNTLVEAAVLQQGIVLRGRCLQYFSQPLAWCRLGVVPLLPKRVASSTEVAELRAELASFKAELARLRGVLRARCLVAGA